MREIYYHVTTYFADLGEYIADHWHNLTPQKYSVLLVFVGIIGWLMMRNQSKKL